MVRAHPGLGAQVIQIDPYMLVCRQLPCHGFGRLAGKGFDHKRVRCGVVLARIVPVFNIHTLQLLALQAALYFGLNAAEAVQIIYPQA